MRRQPAGFNRDASPENQRLTAAGFRLGNRKAILLTRGRLTREQAEFAACADPTSPEVL